jgi:hypothetical protein
LDSSAKHWPHRGRKSNGVTCCSKASTPPDGPRSSRTWSKRRSSLAILGAGRASVTVALHMLEGKQALRRKRSRIRILNNEKLALAAGPYST